MSRSVGDRRASPTACSPRARPRYRLAPRRLRPAAGHAGAGERPPVCGGIPLLTTPARFPPPSLAPTALANSSTVTDPSKRAHSKSRTVPSRMFPPLTRSIPLSLVSSGSNLQRKPAGQTLTRRTQRRTALPCTCSASPRQQAFRNSGAVPRTCRSPADLRDLFPPRYDRALLGALPGTLRECGGPRSRFPPP